MHWRFIPSATFSAEENMAIDESILHHVSQGKSPPTIRFYQWKSPGAISLAYSQRIEDVNPLTPVVRRPTGGRAVFHGEHDFTYSVIIPEKTYPEFLQSYFEICRWLIEGFRLMGISASFDHSTSLLVNGKKISGNAQVRKEGTILQHGTVFYELERNLLPSLFHISLEKKNSFLEKITSVSDLSVVSEKEMFAAFQTSFFAGKEIAIGDLSDEEKSYAKQLAKTKYGTKEWTDGTHTELSKGDCHSQWEEKPERASIFSRK